MLPSTATKTFDAAAQGVSLRTNDESQETQQGSGQISGHVYRADTGVPIAKAIVTLEGVGNSMTQTDADGGYSFLKIGPGSYLVQVTRTGFISGYFVEEHTNSARSAVRLDAGQKLEKIDIRLGRAAIISEKMTDVDGDPVEGLKVYAIRPFYYEAGRLKEEELGESKTDDRGEYRLTGSRPGTYFVRAGGSANNTGTVMKEDMWRYHTAYYPGLPKLEEAQSIKVEAGSEVSAINLQVSSVSRNAYKIIGNVSGASIPSQINLLAGDEIIEDVRVVRDRDWLKTFTISGVSPGQYTIVARSLGEISYSPGPTGISTPQPIHGMVGFATVNVEDTDASVNIQMGEIGELHGKIALDSSVKTNFDGVNLDFDPESGIGALMRRDAPNMIVGTAPNRAFTINYIMPGSYFFTVDDGQTNDFVKEVECGGRDYTLHPIEIEVGTKLEDCRVTVSADVGTIAGSVMDGDMPVPELVVIAIPQSRAARRNPQYTNDVRTDSNGQFQLPVIPGDYFLFAVPRNDQNSYYAPDFAERNQQDAISIKPGESKSIQLKPSSAQ